MQAFDVAWEASPIAFGYERVSEKKPNAKPTRSVDSASRRDAAPRTKCSISVEAALAFALLMVLLLEAMMLTQTVPDVEKGGTYEGPDAVTGLQLYGTDSQYLIPVPRYRSRPTTLGSDADQDIAIPSPFVSAAHCRFIRAPMGLRVIDQKSKNGTYFEGRRKKSFIVEPGQTFYVGARSYRMLALNDQMRSAYPALAAILGYEEEHAIPGETPSPSDLIVAAVDGPHILVTGERNCEQVRLARIVHAISLLRERPLLELDHVPVDRDPEHELVTHKATTVLLRLEDGGPQIDPTFLARLFAAKHQTRVIALASSVDVAAAILGGHATKMKHLWLEPLSGRRHVLHRIFDWVCEEAKSPLRFSALTAENQRVLRRHRWRDNFVSLRQAAERLTVFTREGSFRKAASTLGIALITFHDWYDKTMRLSQPLLQEH